MSGFRYYLYHFIVKAINTISITACFAFCWYSYYAHCILSPFYFKGNLMVLALFAFVYLTVVRVYNGLKISFYRISELVSSQILAVMVTDAVLYVVICILKKGIAVLWPELLCFCVQCLIVVLWSVGAHKWYFHVFRPQKTVIVYHMREESSSLVENYGLKKRFDIQKYLRIEECMENTSLLAPYQAVLLNDVYGQEKDEILKYCVERGIDVYLMPEIGDMIIDSARELHIFHRLVLRVSRYNPPLIYLFGKRLFDFCFALVALILLSPVFLITAIAVISDGGPAFYKQERLTKDGKRFYILKFRSMCVDAEKDGVARLSSGDNDDRITKVGRFIRKVRLDELPQLVNILTGEMSIVGPRPERPEIAAEYEKELPEFRLRLQAKAGLTGYAQVYGKYNTTPYDKLVMDLKYIAHPSWHTDLRLMMVTVKTLFTPDATEGVAVGQTTAMEEKETVKR